MIETVPSLSPSTSVELCINRAVGNLWKTLFQQYCFFLRKHYFQRLGFFFVVCSLLELPESAGGAGGTQHSPAQLQGLWHLRTKSASATSTIWFCCGKSFRDGNQHQWGLLTLQEFDGLLRNGSAPPQVSFSKYYQLFSHTEGISHTFSCWLSVLGRICRLQWCIWLQPETLQTEPKSLPGVEPS